MVWGCTVQVIAVHLCNLCEDMVKAQKLLAKELSGKRELRNMLREYGTVVAVRC